MSSGNAEKVSSYFRYLTESTNWVHCIVKVRVKFMFLIYSLHQGVILREFWHRSNHLSVIYF